MTNQLYAYSRRATPLDQPRLSDVAGVVGNRPILDALDRFLGLERGNEEPLTRTNRSAETVLYLYVELR